MVHPVLHALHAAGRTIMEMHIAYHPAIGRHVGADEGKMAGCIMRSRHRVVMAAPVSRIRLCIYLPTSLVCRNSMP
jgi:hypothetical protein